MNRDGRRPYPFHVKRLGLTTLVLLAALGIAAILGHERGIDRLSEARTRRALNDGVLRVVVLGDSLARGAGCERGLGLAGSLERQLAAAGAGTATVANLGLNGARTFNVRGLLARTPARPAVRAADVIVLSIGGNDLYGDPAARLLAALLPGRSQHVTVRKVERVVGAVRKVNPAAHIYLLGLYNPYRRSSHGAWLDRQVNLWDARLITAFAAARGVTVVRICDLLDRDDRISSVDHFHPGSAGYAAISARIAGSI